MLRARPVPALGWLHTHRSRPYRRLRPPARALEQAAEPQHPFGLLHARDIRLPAGSFAQVVPQRPVDVHAEDPGDGLRLDVGEGHGQPEEHLPEPGRAGQPVQGVDAGRRQRHPEEVLAVVREVIRVARQPIQKEVTGPRLRPFKPQAVDARRQGFIHQDKGIILAERHPIGEPEVGQPDGGPVRVRVVTEQPAGGPALPEVEPPVALVETLRGVREPDGPVGRIVEGARETPGVNHAWSGAASAWIHHGLLFEIVAVDAEYLHRPLDGDANGRFDHQGGEPCAVH
jgi:hypothetical protein